MSSGGQVDTAQEVRLDEEVGVGVVVVVVAGVGAVVALVFAE